MATLAELLLACKMHGVTMIQMSTPDADNMKGQLVDMGGTIPSVRTRYRCDDKGQVFSCRDGSVMLGGLIVMFTGPERLAFEDGHQ